MTPLLIFGNPHELNEFPKIVRTSKAALRVAVDLQSPLGDFTAEVGLW